MSDISIDTLNLRRTHADQYAETNGTNTWATRVAWITLSEGVFFGKKYASKYRQDHICRKSYQNLVNAGVIVEPSDVNPNGGVVYAASPEWESDAGTERWFRTLVDIANGAPVPPTFPANR